jgi:trimethyllysine dioxygenase
MVCFREACATVQLMLCRYEAVRVWNKLLTSKEHEFWIPLKAGTAVGECAAPISFPRLSSSTSVIDNHRVLHGRSAFSGPRRMCGAYIGADEYHSRLRVLQERYARTSTNRSRGERSVWSPGL